MPIALSAVDVYYLVAELRAALIDAFVDKVYQGKEDKGDFLFKVRSPKLGKRQLYIKAPDALFLTEHRFSWPQNPPGFCMQLRKHLGNAKIVGVEQQGFERIVILTFQKGDVSWKLIIELFSKGNVVLVNDQGVIRGVLDLQRWKDRTLRVNAPYEFPPAQVDAPSMTKALLRETFLADQKELVKFLATSIGLGGRYAEEVVARAGLDKHATTLSDDDFEMLHTALQELFHQPPQPIVFPAGAAPFQLKTMTGEPADSFSAAIESHVVTEKVAAIDKEAEVAGGRKTNKHQRIIDEQSAKLAGYRVAAEENQAKGEHLYAHYQDYVQLLTLLQDAHKKGGWPTVKSLIAARKWPVKVDERKGLLIIH